jgi:hypothetical protein
MKFLFYLVVFGYVLRLVFPYLFRGFLFRQMDKVQQQMRNQEAYQQKSKQKEGEIKVKTKPTSSSKNSFDDGEYVDFEEIK